MVAFTLNGRPVETADAPDTPLLWVVRDTFGLKGSKFGCGAGLCEACTLHVDGVAERACVLPVGRVAGRTVLTIEGLGTPERLHPLQAAWRDLSVPQCGYCQPGQIMSAAALLARKAMRGAPGRGLGLAAHSSFESYVAQVAEVSVVGGAIRVHRVLCVIDCGLAVNPDVVRAQMEGSVVYGLSAALHGNLEVENGAIRESNFHDYPILRMHEAPDVEVIIVDSDEPPTGVGEPGVPPVAPAVANAVFAAIGTAPDQPAAEARLSASSEAATGFVTMEVVTMTRIVTSAYDVAEHLRTPEEMAAYLEACIEEADGDAAFIAKALGDIARAKGMSQVASDVGLSRESLYKALSGERNPTLGTVLRVVGALGLKLRAEAVLDPDAAGQRAPAPR